MLACPRGGHQSGSVEDEADSLRIGGARGRPVDGARWRPTSWSISSWGGSWKDLIEETAAKKFTAETGAEVEFITGGTIDRLNKAKLAKGTPESDVTFTTSHVGWLYANDGLFETLDVVEDSERQAHLVAQAKISPYHIGTWAYVYTIVYRPDLVPAGIKFDSWADLWKPELKGKLSAPDFDTSHLVAVAAKLEGGDAGELGEGPGEAEGAQAQLQGLLRQRRGLAAAACRPAKRRCR